MIFSMSFSISEVVLLPIPFTDLTSRKVRPAVVVGQSPFAGDLFVIPISSQLQNIDLPLMDWKAAGLNVPCGIKAQLATIENRLVVKSVGALSVRDRATCQSRLRFWLGL
jgi:mRNA interferase MazF